MTGAIANLLLNALIIVLLAVTIGYCWLLNRRIKILQDSRSELALLLKHFDESTRRASESIIALQTASKKIGENIQFRIDKANYLLDDLAFMIEKGNKLANQMEAGLAVNRARSRVMSEPPPLPPAPKVEKVVAEVETMAEIEPIFPKKQDRQASVKDKTTATLEAVLERVVGRGKMTDEGERQSSSERPKVVVRSRSKSEQELLDMIKAGIKG